MERAVEQVEARLAAYEAVETDPRIDQELRALLLAGMGESATLPEVPPASSHAALLADTSRREPRRRT